MAHSLNNKKSQDALKTKLITALSNSSALNGTPLIWDPLFDSFRDEAMKSVSQWMSEDDINGVVYDKCYAVFKDEVPHTGLVQILSEVLHIDRIEEVCSEVVLELSKIPKYYEIFFPIPNITAIDVEFSQHISIMPNTQVSPLGARLPGSMIKVHSKGFARSTREESAVREAISHIKVTLSIGHLYGLFDRRIVHKISNLVDTVSRTKSENLHYARVREISKTKEEMTILLGLGFSKFLDEIAFKQTTDSYTFQTVKNNATSLVNLMYEPKAEENIRSIRRALEWSFDALIDDDETTRFIKTCIGLEAAVSEQTEGMGITEQLADRTAFLLRRTPKSRQETRETMREIYKLRSKIVHGNVSGLSHKDLETARRATHILSSILKAEINSVSEWWRKIHK